MIWISRLPKLLRLSVVALPSLLLGVLLFAPAALAQAADTVVPQTGMTVIEQWWFLATFLPFLVGLLIRAGMTKQQQSAISMAVYVIYAVFGAALSGQFDGLNWGSVRDIATSIMAVAIIGYTSYKTLWQAVPLPQAVEAATGGDPLVSVAPERNIA